MEHQLLDIFPFVVGRLGAVDTTGVGLEWIAGFAFVVFIAIGFVLEVFIAIEFVTTGGFFCGTSKKYVKFMTFKYHFKMRQ